MTSIRRTLSPAYHDRSYQNGGISLSVNSTSQKIFSNSKNSSTTSFPSAFLALAFAFRRKGNQQWRRLILRWFIFFVVGFLVGITPFGHVDEDDFVRNQYFLVDVTPPHFNARIEENDTRLDVVGGDGGLNRRDLVEGVRFGVGEEQKVEYVPRKQLIVVTPTYKRAMQSYFLNRLGQLLKLVPQPILWIVVEMNSASMETAEILRKTGVMYRHLVCSKNSTDVKDRGVRQRNVALQHIELHKLDGIVYFADDDNIYSLELFDRLRNISRFGTWPVAMLAQSKNKAILEGPVCNGSQVIGWNTNDKSKRLRRFHVDMSGFAFNSTILWDQKRWHRPTSAPIRQLYTVKEGFQETTFIEQVVEDESQMEGTPAGCSAIMNWHLHLDAHSLTYPRGWLLQKNLHVVHPL